MPVIMLIVAYMLISHFVFISSIILGGSVIIEVTNEGIYRFIAMDWSIWITRWAVNPINAPYQIPMAHSAFVIQLSAHTAIRTTSSSYTARANASVVNPILYAERSFSAIGYRFMISSRFSLMNPGSQMTSSMSWKINSIGKIQMYLSILQSSSYP